MHKIMRLKTFLVALGLFALALAPAAHALDEALKVINARPADLAPIGVDVDGSGVKAGVLELRNVAPHVNLPSITTLPSPAWTHAHPTQVAGCIASNHSTYRGVAPGVGLYSFAMDAYWPTYGDNDVVIGGDWMAANGVKIINNSWGYFPNYFAPDGQSRPSKYFDWLGNQKDIIVVSSAGNEGDSGYYTVRSPGDSYNGLTVGATDPVNVHNQVAYFSSKGPTWDDRIKPDIVAPGAGIITTKLNDEFTSGLYGSVAGTSFSAPITAGVAAILTEYGAANSHSTDHKVIKSVMLNSASKDGGEKPGEIQVRRYDGNLWQSYDPGVEPLDDNMGAGQVNALAAFVQYQGGEALPGIQNATEISIDPVGWDREQVTAARAVRYNINQQLQGGSKLTATLVWDRIMERQSTGGPSYADDFNVLRFADLDLYLMDSSGYLIGTDSLGRVSWSQSIIDNVEHIYFDLPYDDFYSLLVRNWSDFSEEFALAVWGHPVIVVPLPSTLMLLAPSLGILMFIGRRRRA